ncbi:MAG: hypothetical protein KAT74_02490 [Candidatus Cloacimonetes bacterium]|nr:hypothetical protein [Candidatus Cloacimonadota bacterium]
MRIIMILLSILSGICLESIDLNLPPSAAHNASSGLSIILDNPSCSFINPAFTNPGVETTAAYLFGLKTLPYYGVSTTMKYKSFGLSAGNYYIAHSVYQENISYLSVNYKIQNFSLGVSFRYLYNKVMDYHKASSIISDCGLLWKNGNISTAVSVKNISQTSFLEESLPIFYIWESCYKITKRGEIAVGLEKQDGFDFCFRIAGKYMIYKMLSILTSYQYEPDRIGLGLIFSLLKFKITYSIRTHQYLNLTHYISMGYVFKKN